MVHINYGCMIPWLNGPVRPLDPGSTPQKARCQSCESSICKQRFTLNKAYLKITPRGRYGDRVGGFTCLDMICSMSKPSSGLTVASFIDKNCGCTNKMPHNITKQFSYRCTNTTSTCRCNDCTQLIISSSMTALPVIYSKGICNVWITRVFGKLFTPNKGDVTLLHPGTRS